MKSLIISDNIDTLTGFRLAGIDTCHANTDTFEQLFDKYLSDNNIAVLIIGHNLSTIYSNKIKYAKETLEKPIIVELPS